MKANATLQELELFKYQVNYSEPVKKVASTLAKIKNLPGVMVFKDGEMMGMISQQKFWEYMSKPYSKEISSRKTIEYIYDYLKVKNLIIPATTKIVDAASMAIKRSKEELEEPIVIQIAPQEYRLINLQKLLVAQSQIHEMANARLMQLYKTIDIANQKLKLSSSLDCLSQLYNRKVFDRYLEREWQKAQKEWQSDISLIVAGLDDFKAYNEIYGSLSGDDAIKKVARTIKKALQNVDGAAGRYGSDRFAIILSDRDAIDAACVVKKIRQEIIALKMPHTGSKVNKYLSMSFGIASSIPSQQDCTNPEMLVFQAEQALINAKKAGKNCMKVWTNSNTSLLFH